jgi:hypothetical protein
VEFYCSIFPNADILSDTGIYEKKKFDMETLENASITFECLQDENVNK